MDFRLGDDELALRAAVGQLADRHFDLGAVGAREGAAVPGAAWRDLAAMGIFGLLAEPGGTVAAAVTVEMLTIHLASGPLVWTTIAAPIVPEVVSGSVRVTGAVSPEVGPAVIPHAAESDLVLVVYPDRVERVATTDLATDPPVPPFDPLTPAATCATLPAGEVIGDATAARALRQAGTVLTAAALVGSAQGALDVAREYALERHQFGVPIGSFQAIKHLLADMYGRVELARAATLAAAALVDDPRAGDPDEAGAIAKLLAGEAGIANGRAAVQILGGMGFTWEMLPHYYLKRSWVLESEFGDGADHALSLGDALGVEVAS